MENLTYSQAIERLDSIMSRIQSGEMELDELTGALGEASALVRFCQGKMVQVDEKVKTIIDELNATVLD